jgi:UDP-N-acetylglucosamine 1-carboxyvinyltransferase
MQSSNSPATQPESTTDCDVHAVGARLRSLRQEAGLTQAAVARHLGTTQSAIARLEAGQQRLSLPSVKRIATVLGCDVALVIAHRAAI